VIAALLLVVQPIFGAAPLEDAEEGPPTAYLALTQEVVALEAQLKSGSFSYHGLTARDQLEGELATLRRAYDKLTGWTRSMPPGCLLAKRRRAEAQPPGPGRDPGRAGDSAGGGARAADGSPDMVAAMCRRRGEPPDELVLEVRAVEKLRQRLEAPRTSYFTTQDRLALERELASREEALSHRGVMTTGVRRVKRHDGRVVR